MTGLVQSFDAGWSGWIREHFAADVFVGSGSRFRLLAGPPMGPRSGRACAGISRAWRASSRSACCRSSSTSRPAFLQGVALDDRLRHGGLDMVEGDLAAAGAVRCARARACC